VEYGPGKRAGRQPGIDAALVPEHLPGDPHQADRLLDARITGEGEAQGLANFLLE